MPELEDWKMRAIHEFTAKATVPFDPFQRVALAIRIEAGDLPRHPSSHDARAGDSNNEAQLAQPPGAPTLPHHLHPFGWCRHEPLHP